MIPRRVRILRTCNFTRTNWTHAASETSPGPPRRVEGRPARRKVKAGLRSPQQEQKRWELEARPQTGVRPPSNKAKNKTRTRLECVCALGSPPTRRVCTVTHTTNTTTSTPITTTKRTQPTTHDQTTGTTNAHHQNEDDTKGPRYATSASLK